MKSDEVLKHVTEPLDRRTPLYTGKDSKGRTIQRPMSPHLGIYRRRLSMMLSIGNRLSGVAAGGGFLFSVLWVGMLALGSKPYRLSQAVLSRPDVSLLSKGWTLAVVFHAVGGVRHLLWDRGLRLTKPQINADGPKAVIATTLLAGILIYGPRKLGKLCTRR